MDYKLYSACTVHIHINLWMCYFTLNDVLFGNVASPYAVLSCLVDCILS
jgi:hypothetical protein